MVNYCINQEISITFVFERHREATMKKKLLIISSLCTICLIAYALLFTHSQASNNSYEYEYYYNDTDSDEDNVNMSADNKDGSTNTKDKMNFTLKLPTEIDTEASSTTVLINKEYKLPSSYVPENLTVPDILFSIQHYEEKKLMRQDAAEAIEELFLYAEKEGLALCGVSGYRSYARQNTIYTNNLRTKGYTYTNLVSAKPGSSEHQSGLAMDVSTASVGNQLEEEFGSTPEGKWLAANSYKFGYIIRYPKDKSEITGYSYEPWHIRFVGIPVATYLYKKDLTLEEFYKYVPRDSFAEENTYGSLIDVEEVKDDVVIPSPSPSPTLSPSPSPSPSSSPTTIPSPSPTPKKVKKTPSPTPEVVEETETPSPTMEVIPTESPIPSATASPEATDTPEGQ